MEDSDRFQDLAQSYSKSRKCCISIRIDRRTKQTEERFKRFGNKPLRLCEFIFITSAKTFQRERTGFTVFPANTAIMIVYIYIYIE